jgi:hypothetical protein
MNIKSLPSLMGSTSKADGYFVGASKTDYTKHFVQQQSHDPARFALLARGCLETDVEFNAAHYVVFISRYIRAFTSEFPVICQWQDIYKQRTLEGRIKTIAKVAVLSSRQVALRLSEEVSQVSAPAPKTFAPVSLDLNWLFSAMKGGTERSSSEQIMSVITGLNALLKDRRFEELNLIIGMVHPQRLSPELMLTFARLTFPVRDLLSSWFPFVRKIRQELDRRDLDSKKLLKGLI